VHVINVPESEFAFNSFFSLHRPLLGLSGEQEFFAVQRTPEEECKIKHMNISKTITSKLFFLIL
jgi:hypothetical protein